MSDIISWDKAIGKKVKSSDDKDLGKVESITLDYIQTKEGMVSKTYYFIPKYHLSGYDGDNLWVSLTKDEVKAKFERENAPEPSEWETQEYTERRSTITQQHPDFAANIPAYKPPSDMVQLSWDKIIGKKVRSSDKKDLGDVESVATEYIEVKEGMVSKKHYYIPSTTFKALTATTCSPRLQRRRSKIALSAIAHHRLQSYKLQNTKSGYAK